MIRARGLVLGAIVATALGGCASSRGADPSIRAIAPTGGPTPTAAPSPATEPEPTDPLQGQLDRRSGFHGKIDPIPPPLAAEMRGATWKPGCPVPLGDLRLLHFNYWGFGGRLLRGPMVVNASVARDVLWVFEQLYQARFPIKRVDLAREFRPERFEEHRRITSHRSVTAAFNCRPVVTPLGPGGDYSQHAYGLAIDINPLQNPFVTADGFVRNRAAEPYTVRSRLLEGMIHEGDIVVRSFAAVGWAWGGHWSGGKDYMHFSTTGV